MPEEHDHVAVSQSKTGFKVPKIVPIIIAIFVVGGLGFYSGVKYQKEHQITATSNLSQSQFGGSAGGFGSGGRRFSGQRPTFGQTTAISSSSITVATNSGSSMTFAITSSTVITDNGQKTSASNITVGETVAVIANSSNTDQASRILVNPSFGGYGPSSSSNNTTAPAITN